MDVDGFDSRCTRWASSPLLAHGFWVRPGGDLRRGGHPRHQPDGHRVCRKARATPSNCWASGQACGKIVRAKPAKPRKAAAQSRGCECILVYLALVPNSHAILASASIDVFNAVFVRGDVVGDTLFYGRGAGKDATASAVLSDIADAALDLKHGIKPPPRPALRAAFADRYGRVCYPSTQAVSRYYRSARLAECS